MAYLLFLFYRHIYMLSFIIIKIFLIIKFENNNVALYLGMIYSLTIIALMLCKIHQSVTVNWSY